MSVLRYTYPDAAAAAAACASSILSQLATATAGGGTATLAISGGATPALMFREMASRHFDWDRVHLFWVDERAVPPTDGRSNYRLAEENLIAPAQIPLSNIHRVQTELSPQHAARRYAEEIRDFFGIDENDIPHFDVIHRGVGPDAHTASLFPGQPLINDREGISSAVWVEKLDSWRITLLPAVLLSAHNTVVLAAGADKAEAIRAIFGQTYDPSRYPAQLGLREGRNVIWYLDEAAASAG